VGSASTLEAGRCGGGDSEFWKEFYGIENATGFIKVKQVERHTHIRGGDARKGTIQIPAWELGVSVGIQSMRLPDVNSAGNNFQPRKHPGSGLRKFWRLFHAAPLPRVDCQATGCLQGACSRSWCALPQFSYRQKSGGRMSPEAPKA